MLAAQRIDDGVHDRRQRAGTARLAAAFDAQRIGLGRHGMALDREARRVLRPWQGVVGEGAGQQLALLVIDGALHNCLAEPLHDAAMRLALDQQRIDDRAEVVDHEVAHQLDRARLGIDLDLADMTAVGERRRRRVGDMRDIERLRHVVRQRERWRPLSEVAGALAQAPVLR